MLDVDHFILWKLNGILSIEEIMEAIQTIKQTSNIDDAIYYINPINLKSIPEIEHAHIITKRSNWNSYDALFFAYCIFVIKKRGGLYYP